MSVPVFLPYALLLAACSDYTVTHTKDGDGVGPDDSGFQPDSSGGDDDVCGPPDLDPTTVDVDESCEATSVGTFTPVIEWQATMVGDAYATPVVGQLTDDNGNGKIDSGDTPDVVVANAVGSVAVLSGDGGTLEWKGGNLGSEPMTPAIGDVDGDGWPDVVASGVNGTVALRGSDGTQLWMAPAYTGGVTAQCGAVGIYDLDGDGAAEVVIGHTVLEGKTGKTLVTVSQLGDGSGHGWAAPYGAAADIDQDGELEVVVGNGAFHKDGSVVFSNKQSDGFVAIANFDSDDRGEMVVTMTGTVRLQDDDGTVLWSRAGITGSTSGPPTVADFDGDGEPEVGVAGMGQYVVLETDGSTKWTRKTNDASSGFTGSAVFDFEGDGAAEVVYADENDVFVFDGATGAVKMQETHHSSATCSEYPSVADVDNDGHAEIIYTSSQYSGTERGVTVIGDADDSWMKSRPVWNQHAYAITNVDDDATVPASPATNWLTYNNFRSGDVASATGGALTDAVAVRGDICTVECEAGRLRVVVAVGNRGISEIPAGVMISAYGWQAGVPVFLSARKVPDAIPSGGTSEGLVFDVDPADVPDGVLEFRADDEDGVEQLAECNEDNNVLTIDEGLCP